MISRRPLVGKTDRQRLTSRLTQVRFSYFVLFIFTLFALSCSLALVPGKVSRANFRALFADQAFVHGLGNFALIALAVSVTGIALASIVGYALSRIRLSAASPTLPGLFLPQLFPAAVLLLPLLFILLKLSLINSYLCVLVIYGVSALPFCIWQMKGSYDNMPVALEEAAILDGCSRWQLFYLIILPLAAPALVVTALFSFLAAWNASVVAPIVVQAVDGRIIPLALDIFPFHLSTQWGLYAAGALLVSIPVMVLLFVISRLLISGSGSGVSPTPGRS